VTTLYTKDLNPAELEPEFGQHMLGLTTISESKAAIAEQLAWRDRRIAGERELADAAEHALTLALIAGEGATLNRALARFAEVKARVRGEK